MRKCIVFIYKSVIVNEIFISRIIWWIYVNKVNFPFVRLFKQFKRSKIVSLNEKIHLSTIINEQVFIFRQYRRMGIQYFVDFLTMLLKHKTIFLTIHIFFKVGKIGKQITCILILRCSRNKGSDFFYFIQQVLTLLF